MVRVRVSVGVGVWIRVRSCRARACVKGVTVPRAEGHGAHGGEDEEGDHRDRRQCVQHAALDEFTPPIRRGHAARSTDAAGTPRLHAAAYAQQLHPLATDTAKDEDGDEG